MKTRTITAFVIFTMMVCLASGAFAAAPKLTVGSATVAAGGTATVNITVDNAAGVTGAAFTLTYDTDKLKITVTSDFFGTFAEQGFTPGQDGLGTDGTVDGLDSPLVENDVDTGKMIAAANAVAAASGTDVLFTLTVESLDDTAAEGTPYDINITATTLKNTAAGYDAAGEQIDLLIEAKDDGTFVPLLTATDAAANVNKGTITIGSAVKFGDVDGDGSVTPEDIYLAIDFMFGTQPSASQLQACDADDSKTVEPSDIFAMIDVMFGGGKR
jgi:hypothetical protein